MATKIAAALEVSPARLPSLAATIAALPRWSILLFAAACVRALTFGNPVVHVDEEFYFVTAQRMLEGALPYVDVWDRKPIGLFLIYLPPAAFGVPLGIWVYQMMALASVVGTALLIARLAEHAGWRRGALVAALLYIFMINFGDGQGGQSPVFYNLLMAWALLLVVPRAEDASGDRRRIHRAMLAMALVGVSMQIKYSVLFEGMFLGLWLMWREWKLGTTIPHILRRGAVLAALAWVPTLLAGTVYFAIGHGDAWVYANFGSILERQSDPPMALARAFLRVALILALPLIVSSLSRKVPVEDENEYPVRALLFGWLIASVVGLIVFGSWFTHYALPVLVPATICCAGFLGGTAGGRKWLAPGMLLIALGGGEFTAWSAMQVRGNASELESLANGIGRGKGCLYVHSGDTILYSYTGRCTVTSWLFPSHLSREREDGAVGVDQIAEERRIFARRPEVVMMRPEYSGERLEIRRVAESEMRAMGYRLTGRYPLGVEMISVYKLPTARSEGTPRLAANRPS
jgi:hypothetical protein